MLMEVSHMHCLKRFHSAQHTITRCLTKAAAKRVAKLTALGDEYLLMGEIDERSMVNAIIGLPATGGPPITPCIWWP
jgi:dihydroxyacid dehydratase/phosphogluconate dehydratase